MSNGPWIVALVHSLWKLVGPQISVSNLRMDLCLIRPWIVGCLVLGGELKDISYFRLYRYKCLNVTYIKERCLYF